MTDDELALLWLDDFDFMSYKKKEKFLQLFITPADMLFKDNFFDASSSIKTVLTGDEYNIMISRLGKDYALKVCDNLVSFGVNFTTIYSKDYPNSLKNIDTPPFVLYYKGEKRLFNNDCFGIVGSRHITSYGKMVTEKFTYGLVDSGFTIVSGLATGVDTIAHTCTVEKHGKTIAVLASGLKEIYPPSNTSLAKRILDEGGLLCSEVKPTRHPEAYMFPIRNRIIAGLCRGILITEAQEKSGVIHTKNYAIDYGKDVFAVPGSIFNISSVGANRMIANLQAKAVLDVEDITSEYNVGYKVVQQCIEELDDNENIIINLLKTGEKTFQELCDESNIDVKTLNSTLTMLIIKNKIKKMAGNVYFLY